MANRYDDDALLELCSKIDLLDYASKSMDFEKRGSDSYATHCCLHVDKTPSLFITPSKNLFHCFSCHVGGTIINWLMIFEHMSFDDAVKKVATMANVDIGNLRQCSALKIYKDISKMYRDTDSNKNIERRILSPSEIDSFADEVPDEWVDEGISIEVMKKYNIRIDHKTNRIVYPVYDNDGNLIGFKGRTRFKNYKTMKIQKYQNYTKIGTTDFLVGLKENKENIKKKNEIIIFEGIKSGMKVEGWGYDNWSTSETGWLNDAQVRILIELGVKNVVIAYDNDVPIKKIYACTHILKRFTNVYAVTDRQSSKKRLLGDTKDGVSPCDRGKEIWETLYEERRKL